MENTAEKQKLKQKWIDFFKVLFDPWVVFLLILIVGLIIISSIIIETYIQTIITTLISIVSGLLGGIISYKWFQMTEGRVIIARGKTAIRGLKLILLNIANIEKRAKHYILSIDTENKEYKLIKNNFEEVIEKCNILEEEIISSIENWTDIIPEVHNLKTQIGIITEMKVKESKLEMEIQKLSKEIESIKTEDSDVINSLKTELNEKVIELSETKERLADSEAEIDKGVLSGLTGTTYYGQAIGAQHIGAQGLAGGKFCSKCGTYFIDYSGVDYAECPDCRRTNK